MDKKSFFIISILIFLFYEILYLQFNTEFSKWDSSENKNRILIDTSIIGKILFYNQKQIIIFYIFLKFFFGIFLNKI